MSAYNLAIQFPNDSKTMFRWEKISGHRELLANFRVSAWELMGIGGERLIWENHALGKNRCKTKPNSVTVFLSIKSS